MCGFGRILCYWLGGSAQLALLGLFLTGLGVASLYPLILSLAIETAPGQSALATTRASLASGVAILVLPLFLGRMADAVGIRLAYGVVVAVLVGLLAILLAARKKALRSRTAKAWASYKLAGQEVRPRIQN